MSDTHSDLRLEALPPLPQSQTIRAIAPRLWQDERVVAIWLGGSLAAGSADQYSDIDMRIAVAPSDIASWEAPISIPSWAARRWPGNSCASGKARSCIT